MKRVLTALILFPLISYVVLWSPSGAVLVVTAAVALLCFYEYTGIAAAYQSAPASWLASLPGYAAGLLILALPSGGGALLTAVAAALVALSLALRADDLRAGVVRAAFLLLGILYIFGCWRFAPLLAARSRYWLYYALVLNWIGDIGAYYAGRAFGRHKLAPIVSPGKSWEGAAASLMVSLVFGVLFLHWAIQAVSLLYGLALTIAANVAGQFGDLCESAIKRGAGVKDSSTLLPGHGGWLDRVDSTLFTLPVVYLFVQWI